MLTKNSSLLRINILKRFLHTSAINISKKGPVDLKGKNPTERKWIIRQMKDPFVKKARQEDYRCRSCFKLLEIQERYNLLQEGQVVVDVGAAPGSWSQVAVEYVLPNIALSTDLHPRGSKNYLQSFKSSSTHFTSTTSRSSTSQGLVLGIDLQNIQPIQGASFLCNSDITHASTQEHVLNILKGRRADVVLSDVAPQATGVRVLDEEASIELLYSVLKFSLLVLQQGGCFLTKAFQGRGLEGLMDRSLVKCFEKVQLIKPKASRSDSSEIYVLARNFRL